MSFAFFSKAAGHALVKVTTTTSKSATTKAVKKAVGHRREKKDKLIWKGKGRRRTNSSSTSSGSSLTLVASSLNSFGGKILRKKKSMEEHSTPHATNTSKGKSSSKPGSPTKKKSGSNPGVDEWSSSDLNAVIARAISETARPSEASAMYTTSTNDNQGRETGEDDRRRSTTPRRADVDVKVDADDTRRDSLKNAACSTTTEKSHHHRHQHQHQHPFGKAKDDDSEKHDAEKTRVPVYVMLPLDVVRPDGRLNERHKVALPTALEALSKSGVDGVMLDFWWGIIEREGPKKYDWWAFSQLLKMIKRVGLKLSVVLSFHSCGNNVGDTDAEFEVPLPQWVVDAAESDGDLFYTDQHGFRNLECLSLWADGSPLAGRTVLQCYSDFMEAFRDKYVSELGSTITEITIGCGPCGELRYPSYPQGRWRFPGIGEFQCFDRNALGSLAHAAASVGHIEWGGSGPHDAGTYNCLPHDTGFFCANGNWASDYGRFFLNWYSGELISHGDRMLTIASEVFGLPGDSNGRNKEDPTSAVTSNVPKEGSSSGEASIVPISKQSTSGSNSNNPGVTFGQVWHRLTGNIGSEVHHSASTPKKRLVQLSIKCSGVHWWFLSRSHAAELTAGYYNTHDRDGYDAIASLCARHDARLNFTCMEMRNSEHPEHACCGPEGLLLQVREAASRHNTPFVGENALTRFDRYAYDRIIENVYFDRDLLIAVASFNV